MTGDPPLLATGTLTWTAGDPYSDQTITVDAALDTEFEGEQVFQVELELVSGQEGDAELGNSIGIGTIEDFDAPEISVTTADSDNEDSVDEGGDLVFQVCIDKNSEWTTSFDVNTYGLTATGGHDYTEIASTPKTIGPNSGPNACVPVNIETLTDNYSFESPETLLLVVSNPVNANLSATQNTGIGTITNVLEVLVSVSGPADDVVEG